MDGVFEVVFEGRMVPGRDPADVRINLAGLFKAKPETVERLFGGALVVIKKDLDYASAMRYISAMRDAGALARLRQQEGAVAAPKAASEAWTVAPPGERLGGLKAAPPIPPDVDLDQFSLAPVGATLGTPREYAAPPVNDMPEVSIAEVGAILVEAHEFIPLPEPDFSGISVAEVGATLGSPREIIPVPIGDIDSITIAEVGARLDVAEKVAPPPPPKTDHLQLG